MLLRLLLALTALGLTGTAAPAQSDAGLVVGEVREAETRRPLGAALVSLRGTPSRALTDAEGRFRLSGVPPGRYTLEIRMIGHRPEEVPVEVGEEGATRVSVELRMQPIALDPVRVEGAPLRTANVMRGFYERMAKGRGQYLTREDLEARRPRTLAQALEMVPGVRVHPVQTPFGRDYVVQMGRSLHASGYLCEVAHFLDGMPYRQGITGINSEIRPEDVEGIEVYSGASQIPPEFNSGAAGSACGVVVIWTRLGSR